MDRIQIKPGEVHFFYTLVNSVTDPDLLRYYREITSSEEKEKVDRYVFEKDRHISLVTRALLRYLLSVFTGAPPKGFEFVENKYGKPSLADNTDGMPLEFNLSHTSGIIGAAFVRDQPVGLDLEDHSREVDIGIADRFFSKSEADYLNNSPENCRRRIFFDFWTLKEAYIKARGKGLSIALDSFGFDISEKTPKIAFSPLINQHPGEWQFFSFSPTPVHKGAIAVHLPSPSPFTLFTYQCIPFSKIQPL